MLNMGTYMMQASYKDESEFTLHSSLSAYIALCNDVIDANQSRFPFAQIWRALEAEIAGRPIEYSVIHGLETAKITATFIDLKINIVSTPPLKKWPQVTQKIDWLYMISVLEKPAKFIANPALIDWNIKINNKVVQLFN